MFSIDNFSNFQIVTITMSDLKTVLTKIVSRRRLTGGEFSYVFRPTGESVAGKKAVWGMVKGDAEVYDRIRGEVGLNGEEENQFDARALKVIPLVAYEEDVTKVEEMEVTEAGDGGGWKEVLTSEDLFRKVHVDNFEKKSKAEDCESFLRQFDNVVVIKRVVFGSKAGKELFKGAYEVTFKDKESADKFLDLPELKFGERLLNKKLLRTVVQGRMLRRMQAGAFSHNKRITECIAAKVEEEKSVFVLGLGKNL